MPSSSGRLDRYRSLLNTARASQIKANPRTLVIDISSSFIKIPIKNIIVGVIYCKSPTVLSGNLVVDPLNRSSGITVAAPAPKSSMEMVHVEPNSALPLPWIIRRNTKLGRKAKSVSKDRVSRAPRFNDFLIKL